MPEAPSLCFLRSMLSPLFLGAGVEALLALLMQGPTPASHFYAGRALVHVATDHPEGRALVIGRIRQALVCPNTLQFRPPPFVGDEQLKEIQQVHEQVCDPLTRHATRGRRDLCGNGCQWRACSIVLKGHTRARSASFPFFSSSSSDTSLDLLSYHPCRHGL